MHSEESWVESSTLGRSSGLASKTYVQEDEVAILSTIYVIEKEGDQIQDFFMDLI